jgi:RNA polymerase sigma-70 factor, ECF subfamily
MTTATPVETDPTPRSLPDGEALLLAEIRAGDQRACEELVRTYGGRMLAVARRFFSCEHDANDAVQDAFLSAFGSLHRFEGNSALGTWLHRIVVNACLMRLRRHKHDEASIDDLLPTFDQTGHHVTPPQTFSDEVVEHAQRAETATIVRAAIDQLPESYRTVLLLRDIEELDTTETAAVLNCTPGNVKTRLHRARQALRTLLQQQAQSLH